MRPAYTAAQTRELEAVAIAATTDDTLMQRASHGLAGIAAAQLRRRYARLYGTQVVILVGPGNNGGDALFAGARLAARGVSVLAVRALGQPHARGMAALLAAGGRIVELDAFDPYAFAPGPGSDPEIDLVLDGILGIGGRPGLPEQVATLTRDLVSWGVPIIAVDLPSGVETDTGAAPDESVRATRTVTFGFRKPCHLIEPALTRCGHIDLVDIGLDAGGEPPELVGWEIDDLAARWPFPDESSDKYSRGVVGIDSGSESYPGAAIMNTYGAVYAGAGMVRFLGPESAARVIGAELPNVVFANGRVQAHLLGSGWGERSDGHDAVATAVDSGVPVLIDADGLKYLPKTLPSSCLLTPHAGELAQLLGGSRAEVQADPVAAVKAAVAQTGATVLLKGASQFVASPDTVGVGVAVPGPAWTAQAGSGDTLAGICAALLAAGVSASDAGLLGASLQAATAAAHPGPLPPHVLAQRSADLLGSLQRRTAASS
ncbi:MAG: bifunctional ADP-dependent NAD(P)H-hydrate dehydratase/NAD(P)H-hydrate epimerase [Propionibacteriaceae bacterium]